MKRNWKVLIIKSKWLQHNTKRLLRNIERYGWYTADDYHHLLLLFISLISPSPPTSSSAPWLSLLLLSPLSLLVLLSSSPQSRLSALSSSPLSRLSSLSSLPLSRLSSLSPPPPLPSLTSLSRLSSLQAKASGALPPKRMAILKDNYTKLSSTLKGLKEMVRYVLVVVMLFTIW